ncbi:MAG TPA: DUF4350 domain-containing protein [Acidimicrobiales bacterium]
MTMLDHLPALRSPDSLLGRAQLSGLRALLAALQSGGGPGVTVTDHLDAQPDPDVVVVLVADRAPTPATVEHLRHHLARGGRAVVALSPASALALAPLVSFRATGSVLAAPGTDNPLVLDPHLVGTGAGVLGGLHLEADDLVALEATVTPTVTPAVTLAGQTVAFRSTIDSGELVVVGSLGVLTNRWIAAADNATIVAWAITGTVDPALGSIVRDHVPHPGAGRGHTAVEAIDNGGDDAVVALLPTTGVALGSPEFLRAAGRAGRLLSPSVHDALCDFGDVGAPAGAVLLKGLPVGEVPATPASPLDDTGKDHISEFVLLTVARRLGQPIGYEPEHGGDIVQNLLPTRGDVARQTSTSSGVELEFHTETAFHPHKPRFLLLLCLRGDPQAQTLLCSISQVVGELPLGVQQVLREPRFRTGIDESFTGTRSDRRGRAMAVLGGTEEAPTFTFDADLMAGLDPEAADALEALRSVIRREHIGVALEAGDLLVVDNSVAVHGRSSFTARFDGTDRWLQRTFVVTDLAASATHRRGRVVTTRFA